MAGCFDGQHHNNVMLQLHKTNCLLRGIAAFEAEFSRESADQPRLSGSARNPGSRQVIGNNGLADLAADS